MESNESLNETGSSVGSSSEHDESDLIGGRYELIEVLGQGGMGTVLKARHTNLDKVVAIKVLHASLLVDETSKPRFEIEAKAGSKLSHPNLVAVFDYGFTHSNEPFLVMEYVEGETLDQLVAKNGKLSTSEFLHTFTQMCKALQYIHNNGIIHRDLKPSNIMIQVIGDERYAKLLDFGIAKVLADSGNTAQHLTATGTVFGSPLFMSPEQCQGEKLDGRSDIYSLGCVMYVCLAGTPPLQGENPLQTIFKHVNQKPEPIQGNREIGAIIEKCLEKNPAQRFQNANELLSALSSVGVNDQSARKVSDPSQNQIDEQERQQLLLLQSQKFERIKNTNSNDEHERESTSTERGAKLREIGRPMPTSTSSELPAAWSKMVPLIVVLIILVPCAMLATKYLPEMYQKYVISQADSSFKQGQMNNAETQYKDALKLVAADDEETRGIIQARLGRIYFQLGRNDNALSNFAKAVKQLEAHKNSDTVRDDYLDAVFGKAQSLSLQNSYREADSSFNDAIKIAVNEASPARQEDIFLSAAKNAAEYDLGLAMRLFDHSIKAYSRSDVRPNESLALALISSAEVREKQGKPADAASLAEQAKNQLGNSTNSTNPALRADIQGRIAMLEGRTKQHSAPLPTPSFNPNPYGSMAGAASSLSPMTGVIPPVMPIVSPMGAANSANYEAAMKLRQSQDLLNMQAAANARFRDVTSKLNQYNSRP